MKKRIALMLFAVFAFSFLPCFSSATPLSAAQQEDALVLDKTLEQSSENEDEYTLRLEAYATGEVKLEQELLTKPCDIVLVLDRSGSMSFPYGAAVEESALDSTKPEGYYSWEYSSYFGTSYYKMCWGTGLGRSAPNYTGWWCYAGRDGYIPAYLAAEYSGGRLKAYVSRWGALSEAAKSFADKVKENALSENVNHRIAIASFSNDVLTSNGESVLSFPLKSVVDNLVEIKESIGHYYASGATRADLGLKKAVDYYAEAGDEPSRSRVVVFFTDGSPTSSSSFEAQVANNAVQHAYALKNTYGAKIFTIGVFDGADASADPALASTTNENKYMQAVSSNYPYAVSFNEPKERAAESDYYKSPSTGFNLNNIFEQILTESLSGETSVTLDERAVIKDVMSPYFSLKEGIELKDIKVFTMDYAGNSGGVRQWNNETALSSEDTVIIADDGKGLSFSGFDLSENYVADIIDEQSDEVSGLRGKKLVIEVPVRFLREEIFGGSGFESNANESGIYDSYGNMVKSFPQPLVQKNITYEQANKDVAVFLGRRVKLSDMVEYASGCRPNGFNNAKVDIEFTLQDGEDSLIYMVKAGEKTGQWSRNGNAIVGIGLFNEDKSYKLSVKVTDVGNKAGEAPVEAFNEEFTLNAYVLKPTIEFNDIYKCMGESCELLTESFMELNWTNENFPKGLPSEVVVLGSEPSLEDESFRLEIFSDKLLENEVEELSVLADAEQHFYVKAFVKDGEGENEVTDGMKLINACSEKDHPEGRAFSVHLKTFELKIIKEAGKDISQSFMFALENEGDVLFVSIDKSDFEAEQADITISGLYCGKRYRLYETNWSYQYKNTGVKEYYISSESDNALVEARFSNEKNGKWFYGDSCELNSFEP